MAYTTYITYHINYIASRPAASERPQRCLSSGLKQIAQSKVRVKPVTLLVQGLGVAGWVPSVSIIITCIRNKCEINLIPYKNYVFKCKQIFMEMTSLSVTVLNDDLNPNQQK